MSTVTAYNALGRGLDMSGLTNGVGFFVNDGSTTVTYLYDIDFDTALFLFSGASPIKYGTVSIGDVYLNGDVVITDLYYYNKNFSSLISWDNANIVVNIYDDFSFGTIADILWGPDQITGNSYNDIIKGGYGNDRLRGQGGNDRLYGEGNNDSLFGDSGRDYLSGGSGKDRLIGGAGSDTLNGDGGDDEMVWDGLDTKVNGGAGIDWLECGTLDLTRVSNSRVVSIEGIDMMSNASNNRLTLNARDALDMSSSNIVGVIGDSGDSVNIVGSFRYQGEVGGFDKYSFGGATLLVNPEVLVY